MNKSELAGQLRKRQESMTDRQLREELGLGDLQIIHFRRNLQNSSDDDIIDSYITCSCCGEKQVGDKEALDTIIAASNTADEFFDLCNHHSKHHMEEQK